ncbi:MAG TPA: 30S ribosomal protein S12 methylthiotransferase RimO [Spirochaetia bacterium]|nr:30S ribosomal protein S12 methylthiotransferase RimO [Spirochaetales bacterium]HRY73768.1 30S ribosomal protein S12 methylthiotransferase RimO [Spirochaetia bacterium]
MRFYLDQRGCAKNQVDGEEIGARLEASGHAWAPSADEADLIIVNSCGFIEDAKKESLDAVLDWKARYPGKRVLLAGCLAQRYAADLAEGLPEADGIVGNADLAAVVAAAEETAAGGRPVRVPEAAPSIGAFRRGRLLDFPGTAHVKITEGCSNGCSYCAIPLIRGSLKSRPVEEVVAECRDLVARGIRELVLVGQDLGAYGRELSGGELLPPLLSALSATPGDFRVRTLYIHPDNFPYAILPIIKADPRLLPYFDLPFQHASAPVLRAMNRKGSPEAYLRLLSRIREALPDAVIRSTFLLGFPGETDEDFAALRGFQEAARIDWLGAFAYSREEGTAAYAMKGRVPKKTVAERKKAVEEAQERITSERLARFVGRELEVLVEEPVEGAAEDRDGGEELSLGRAWLQAPEVDGLTVLRGRFEAGTAVRAKVLAVNGVDLDARPL